MAGTLSKVVIGGRGRVSKKRNTKSSNNQLTQPSSVNEVESMNDMLIQIFLRLPIISLILFKSVCKRWFNLITSSHFIKLRNEIANIHPTSGLFLQRPAISIAYDFVALDTRIQTHGYINNASFPFGSYPDRRDIEILQSCNGLLLCYLNRYMIYVYNPFTKQFKMLPQNKWLKLIACINGIKMVFDPTKSPHYKVIFVATVQVSGRIEDGSLIIKDVFVQIQTYSSETCDWSTYREESPLSYYKGFRNGVYWNDAIYWLNMDSGLIFKLDIVNLSLTSVPTPLDLRAAGSLDFTHELFESRGSLLLACVFREPNLFLKVYEKKRGYSDGWSLKYLINVSDILSLIPEEWEVDKSARKICVRCIVLEEREEDSFMVIELYGKVVRYKMVTNTLHEFSDVGAIPRCVCMEPHRFSCFPITASFAGV